MEIATSHSSCYLCYTRHVSLKRRLLVCYIIGSPLVGPVSEESVRPARFAVTQPTLEAGTIGSAVCMALGW